MKNVAVVGLGYVGVPLILALIKAGVDLIGYDINKRTIDKLNKGVCHLPSWEKRFTQEVSPGENIKFSSSYAVVITSTILTFSNDIVYVF